MLTTFLNRAHSPYQAVLMAIEELEAAGFAAAKLSEIGGLEAGKYYVKVHDSALFAMVIPEEHDGAIHIATAHTDFPCFKLKPQPDMKGETGNCQRLNVEPYGGMLKRTWFDRPLGIAGAVWTKGEDEFNPEMKLVDINEPIAVIPSLAPHMDREIETKKIDAQKELLPVVGLAGNGSIMDVIAERVGCEAEDILSMDVNLFACEGAIMAGVGHEFVMSKAIDNIASVAALTEAMSAADGEGGHISMICLFDNEEIGSRTKQGADSNTLKLVLDQLPMDYEKSFIISVDGAHGVHPNYPEKSDPTSAVQVGKGIAIKTSASQRYATDGRMIAMVRSICDGHKIPYQIHANKSGAPGGSTLGPIISAYIPVPATDIGIPMLAMHSARELAAVKDYEALVAFVKCVM
ncbi:MAG: M18 family aminopeptidase [Eubacterium sp.]|nr:M18 family aminopeptidase [Candidatus Colimonas fimequi]